MANELLDNQEMTQSRAKARSKGRYSHWYGGFGIMALLAIVLAVTMGGRSSVNAAPNFAFTLYQGDSELGAHILDMADLRGKPVVLNFWAGLCPPCRTEMLDLQLFHDEFKDKITIIIFIVEPLSCPIIIGKFH